MNFFYQLAFLENVVTIEPWAIKKGYTRNAIVLVGP